MGYGQQPPAQQQQGGGVPIEVQRALEGLPEDQKVSLGFISLRVMVFYLRGRWQVVSTNGSDEPRRIFIAS